MNIRYLILALTTRCNPACRYCYNGRPSKVEDMPEAVMQRALSLTASGDEPFHLQLTGGEPAMAPGLSEKRLNRHATPAAAASAYRPTPFASPRIC